jgi:hypothetical protein
MRMQLVLLPFPKNAQVKALLSFPAEICVIITNHLKKSAKQEGIQNAAKRP